VTLVPLPDLLADARRNGYALGYFEAWDGYSLEAVVSAAEAERAPVILGFGCLLVDPSWLDAGGIGLLGALGRAAADGARVPVSLLLNETHSTAQATAGLDAGFNAVMAHAAGVDEIAGLVRAAHARGAAVEGELGELPTAVGGGVDDTGASSTDPDEAAAYVEATGVDCLAVSVGNVHLLEHAVAEIDLDLLGEINRRTGVPLVVHGGTGFPPAAVPGAIARGVAKFNVGTILKRTFLDAVAAALASAPPASSPHDLIGSRGSSDVLAAGADKMRAVVRSLIEVYGGSGRA
jgi:fructose/tagatose bisphosphate aldolase